MSASSISLADVEGVLSNFNDPESGRDIRSMDQVADLKLEGDHLSLTLGLTTHCAPLWEETRTALVEKLQTRLAGLATVTVDLAVIDRPPQKLGQVGLTAKSVIAVASGKGGVGKSTIATSLAIGLKRAGCAVGLMDADVYGPSIPHLLGAAGKPEVVDQRIQPISINGLNVMSMGFLVPPDEAVVWRGPMLHGAITQFLRDTEWGSLDYLIIDMPPGTGDIALTLSQLLPLTGAVIVCTPQDLALLDAVKAISMHRKVNIPILGLVENMSYFLCPDCDKRYDIFGSGGARRRAEELDIPFLGDVPINMQIRIHGDEGNSIANFEDAETAKPFEQICHGLARQLADQNQEEPPLPSLTVL
jgi:ATP-binding protein involved in chromosome partitioning